MTETFYRTGTCKTDHSEFGGRIYISDFNRRITLSDMAARIMADKRFDQRHRKETAQAAPLNETPDQPTPDCAYGKTSGQVMPDCVYNKNI